MNRTCTMALAGALMLGGSLGVGAPALRAQAYATPPWALGVPAYTIYPAGSTYSTPSPYYASTANTTTAPPPAPVNNPALIGTLEDRIRALESRLQGAGQGAGGSSGAVIDFIDERGW